MFLFLVVSILLLLIYTAWKAASLARGQAALAAFLEAELKEIKAAQEPPCVSLAYGWFDDGWPLAKVNQEDRAPLENPTPHLNPDEYKDSTLPPDKEGNVPGLRTGSREVRRHRTSRLTHVRACNHGSCCYCLSMFAASRLLAVLVNNAALFARVPVESVQMALYERIFDTNLKGAVATTIWKGLPHRTQNTVVRLLDVVHEVRADSGE